MGKKISLKEAHKKEKDPRVKERIVAVHNVTECNITIESTAQTLFKCPDWVRKWVERYESEGLDGLRDRPRSGRPRITTKKKMTCIMRIAEEQNMTTREAQKFLAKKTKHVYHIIHVRKFVYENNLSLKKGTKVSKRRAINRQITNWLYRLKRLISASKGIPIVALDESWCTTESIDKQKRMSRMGVPIPIQYDGSHQKFVMYLAVSDDGEVFKTYEKFDTKTVLKFLKTAYKKVGRCILLLDKASQHTSKTVKRWAKEHGIILCYFPTGTPERNVVEQYWNDTKRDSAVGKSHYTIYDVRRVTSAHYRTMRPYLSVTKYLDRKLDPVLTNF